MNFSKYKYYRSGNIKKFLIFSSFIVEKFSDFDFFLKKSKHKMMMISKKGVFLKIRFWSKNIRI